MKRVLLVCLLLAACHKAPQEHQPAPDGEAQLWRAQYQTLVREGWSPVQAKQQIEGAMKLPRPTDAELDYDVQQHQKDLVELHKATCKSAPYLKECS